MESAYKFTEYRYRFLKETKNFSSANSRTTKNEQIRKFSQKVEKTRSELKKVKTGVNKEFDQPNKSKKGRSTSNRRKREEILEIPVLPENTSNDQQAKEA
ncbi:hypothetical protein GLOIN_2v1504766, partial [Rhizophagus irregularis DAOM 181602=DAOM 197198]